MIAQLYYLQCFVFSYYADAHKCPHRKEYDQCGTACPLTCENYLNPPQFCTLQCVAGCFCPKGTVEFGSFCVDPKFCPRKFGVSY